MISELVHVVGAFVIGTSGAVLLIALITGFIISWKRVYSDEGKRAVITMTFLMMLGIILLLV